MPYLTGADDIRAVITQFSEMKTIWADTEVADWDTPHPRLSLIQVLADPTDLNGDSAYVLDVLDQPELVTDFVKKIMANPEIEKVFHYASYDVTYLGGYQQVKNVTCTFKLVRKLTKKSRRNPLKVSNKKLKTLAVELCQFSQVDTEEQCSDWGQRPLTDKQLKYAKMDTVYLAHVHLRLLEIRQQKILESELLSKQQSQQPEYPPFSVTKVRVAFECPRLFYLKQHFGGDTLFVPASQPVGIATAFHKLSEQLLRAVRQHPQFNAWLAPVAEQLKVSEIASQMQGEFYQLVFSPYRETHPELAAVLPQFWQGLTVLIRHWANLLVVNRRYCSVEEVIEKTFVSKESKLNHDFSLPNGKLQGVAGKCDRITFDFERNRFCVVDYKTYEPVNLTAQLVQAALYSYMIWEKKRVPVDSAVYCVLPEFKEYYYSWEKLEAVVHQLIPDKLQQMRQWQKWKPPQPNPPNPTNQSHLCEICPQQEKCQDFF